MLGGGLFRSREIVLIERLLDIEFKVELRLVNLMDRRGPERAKSFCFVGLAFGRLSLGGPQATRRGQPRPSTGVDREGKPRCSGIVPRRASASAILDDYFNGARTDGNLAKVRRDESESAVQLPTGTHPAPFFHSTIQAIRRADLEEVGSRSLVEKGFRVQARRKRRDGVG